MMCIEAQANKEAIIIDIEAQANAEAHEEKSDTKESQDEEEDPEINEEHEGRFLRQHKEALLEEGCLAGIAACLIRHEPPMSDEDHDSIRNGEEKFSKVNMAVLIINAEPNESYHTRSDERRLLFLLDSRATCHVTNEEMDLLWPEEDDSKIIMAQSSHCDATKSGTMVL